MLKLRFPLPRPTRANRSVLPACCAAVLAAAIGVQLALTGAVELPQRGWSGGGARWTMPEIGAVPVDPTLRAVPIFAPDRTSVTGAAAGAPLGGAVVAGSVSVRGQVHAILQKGDGSIVRLPLGGRFAGMRLIGLSGDGATFLAGGKPLRVPFGATAVAPANQAEIEEEQ